MKSWELKCTLFGMLLLAAPMTVGAPIESEKLPELMSLVFRETPIAELFEMLSRKERVNIVLARGVTGNVAVNLYDLTLRQAIHAIAEAGGFAVLERASGYLIFDPKTAPPGVPVGKMEVKSMKVQYSDPKLLADILARHLSQGGKITVLDQRKRLIVEDTAEGLVRIEALLREIDAQPQQIMIEAKILEITLDNDETFGIDWTKIFSSNGVNSFGASGLATQGAPSLAAPGVTGLATQPAPGLFFNFVNRNVQVYLSALSNKGRVHTLATPKLMTLENQEASTNIGDKLGYSVTTTINSVTTQSVQFLDTGVILRVTPSVDAAGRIMMKIRPEVSSGSITAGIPSKNTTEVTTQLVAEDGQAILIAGLIKNTSSSRRIGIPILGDLPGIGRLFSSSEDSGTYTETIVLITPHVVGVRPGSEDRASIDKLEQAEDRLLDTSQALKTKIDVQEGRNKQKPLDDDCGADSPGSPACVLQ